MKIIMAPSRHECPRVRDNYLVRLTKKLNEIRDASPKSRNNPSDHGRERMMIFRTLLAPVPHIAQRYPSHQASHVPYFPPHFSTFTFQLLQ